MKKLLLTLAVAAMGFSAYADQVTDVITWESLGSPATTSTYKQVAVSQTTSGAEYLINCGYDADKQCFIINANGGFVLTTSSPGSVASVAITNASGNSANLKIYAQNTPFEQPTGSSWTNAQVATMLGTAIQTGVKSYDFAADYTYMAIQGSASCQITQLEITWNVPTQGSVAQPSISFENTTNTVTLACNTTDAKIYYTLNGEEPSTSSTEYDQPFTISETCTVKAVASLNNELSSVASKECVYYGTYSNYADYIAANPTNGGKVEGPISVIYQNGQNLFTKDNTGRYMLVYGTVDNSNLTNGDQLEYVAGNYTLYNGLPEIGSPSIGNVTTGNSEIDPVVYTLDQLNQATEAELSTYVKIVGVTIKAGTTNRNYIMTDAEGNTATLYDSFNNAADIPQDEDKLYTLIGFVGTYNSSRQLTYAFSIEETQDETYAYNVTFNFTGIANVYEHFTIGNSNPMEVTETLSSDTYILSWNQGNGMLFVKPAEGYKIASVASTVNTIVPNTEAGAGVTGTWTDYEYYGCYYFSLNPDAANDGAIITITFAEDNGDDDGDTEVEYEVAITYSPADLVESASFMGANLDDIYVISGSYDSSNPHDVPSGYLIITLKEDNNIESAKVTLTTADGATTNSYDIADNTLSFEVNCAEVTAIAIEFVEPSSDVTTEATVTLYFAVTGETVSDYNEYFVVTENGDEVELTGSSYSVTYEEGDTVTLTVQAVEGYHLSFRNDGVAENEVSEADGVYTITLSSMDNNGMSLNFGATKNTAGINSILNSLDENNAIYNLHGVKIQNPAKGGMYIINGQKVLVK